MQQLALSAMHGLLTMHAQVAYCVATDLLHVTVTIICERPVILYSRYCAEFQVCPIHHPYETSKLLVKGVYALLEAILNGHRGSHSGTDRYTLSQ